MATTRVPCVSACATAYASGTGISYVEVKGDKSTHVFRYGDMSRKLAQRQPASFILFSCYAPHTFAANVPKDKAVLVKARIAHKGDAAFAALDASYVARCHNPLVKSAVTASNSSGF